MLKGKLAWVIAAVGLGLIVVALFAEQLGLVSYEEVFWIQRLGVCGGAFVVYASLAQIKLGSLLAGGGLTLIGLSVFADSLGLGSGPDLGLQQQIGVIVGALLVIGGLGWERRSGAL